MTEDFGDRTPELAYTLYRFTSCPFITSLYMGQNHGHVCEDCKCIRCVVLRWVRMPTCNCKLPPPRQGLSLGDRVRKKRLACLHEPRSVPIFPPAFCFCVNPEKKAAQLLLANPERNDTTSSEENYLDYYSDCSTECVDSSVVDGDNDQSNDNPTSTWGDLRKL